MKFFGNDTLKIKDKLKIEDNEYYFFNIPKALQKLHKDIHELPFTIRILLENLLRFENGKTVTSKDIEICANWVSSQHNNNEIAFTPARVLMQDFTGVPAVVDLAAMRDTVKKLGGDAQKINPLSPVHLVIDHSVQVDSYALTTSLTKNNSLEMERNKERYEFLKWGQEVFDNFKVVPPGTGICHQVNLEYLARVVWKRKDEDLEYIFPDTLVGTDSHTTMVNSLGVLGWGVGGIEAEAVMLGQSTSMILPQVVGLKLKGKLSEGVTATDLVLTITEILRKKGVVEKFVEFYGEGLQNLSLSDRATIANMAPEYGATCGFFPVDSETLNYLRLTGREESQIKLIEEYCKIQGLWHDKDTKDPKFSEILELDLISVEPSLAGPKRPQDKVILKEVKNSFANFLKEQKNTTDSANINSDISDGSVLIAAITSCTNTSNPSVMVAAGLVAKKAVELGLTVKPWVKTSLAPGSQVVSEYLNKSGLQQYLDKIGFNIVGFGCTTCIGNSGPLKLEIEEEVQTNKIVGVSVLSGNRNFEGRVHPLCKANYLASPPLVVMYALVGHISHDLQQESLGQDKNGKDVYFKDLWPTNQEIKDTINSCINRELFISKYNDVFRGNSEWQQVKISKGEIYNWNKNSTYIQNPPYFENMTHHISPLQEINGAKLLAMFGDSITTDHISPAGNIAKNSPAAKYLLSCGVEPQEFNSYGSRRGNHEVMMRGTFANIRIKNELLPGTEGGVTKLNEQVMSIYDAAMLYKNDNIPLIIIAGKEYGTGSSRDWAAKGTILLGVKIVIAESFERIHRSNLVRMGIIPVVFKDNMTRKDLTLDGSETFDFRGISDEMTTNADITCIITTKTGTKKTIILESKVDTLDELEYLKHKGILHKVVRDLS